MNCVIMPVRHARSHVCACTDGGERLSRPRIPESATSVAASPQRCVDMSVFSVESRDCLTYYAVGESGERRANENNSGGVYFAGVCLHADKGCGRLCDRVRAGHAGSAAVHTDTVRTAGGPEHPVR